MRDIIKATKKINGGEKEAAAKSLTIYG